MRKMVEEKPPIKSLFNRLEDNEEKVKELMAEIKEAIGEEEMERIIEETEEELFGKVEDRDQDDPTGPGQDDPTGPGNQGPGPGNNDRNGRRTRPDR
jgi:uncharacterized protein with von Willebrand factor type A (vWA) domain